MKNLLLIATRRDRPEVAIVPENETLRENLHNMVISCGKQAWLYEIAGTEAYLVGFPSGSTPLKLVEHFHDDDFFDELVGSFRDRLCEHPKESAIIYLKKAIAALQETLKEEEEDSNEKGGVAQERRGEVSQEATQTEANPSEPENSAADS